MRSTNHSRDNERGQVIVLAALLLAGVIGAVALSIDVGMIMHTRTDLQKSADAMALAGAQDLCGTTSCEYTADESARKYGTLNGVASPDATVVQFGVDCDGGTSANHDMITVKVTRYQKSYLAGVIGYKGGNIPACATARKFAIGALSGVRPFGLEDNCITEIDYGDIVVLKHDSDSTRVCDALQGNFGQLAIDGTGGDEVREGIQFGTDSAICADSVPGCENYLFATQTGDQIGPVKAGIKYVYDNTPVECDTWAEVVTGSGTEEKITPACNPWRPGYTGISTRLWIIPIVDGMWDSGGNNDIQIKSFAIVFLEDNSKCTGNSCDLRARFVEASVNLPGTARVDYYDGAKATAVVLVK